MFALAPLSGRLADRLGGVTTISFGIGTLVAATVLAASASVIDDPMLALGLFLLGYGWNLCFVGGSSLLSRGLPLAEQARTQGVVDAVVWSTSALASLLSGALLASGGYVLVAAVGGAVAVLPVIVIVLGRRSALAYRDRSAVAP
jgi:MFS family permease